MVKELQTAIKTNEQVGITPPYVLGKQLYLLELRQLSWLAHILKMLQLNKLAMDLYLFWGGSVLSSHLESLLASPVHPSSQSQLFPVRGHSTKDVFPPSIVPLCLTSLPIT